MFAYFNNFCIFAYFVAECLETTGLHLNARIHPRVFSIFFVSEHLNAPQEVSSGIYFLPHSIDVCRSGNMVGRQIPQLFGLVYALVMVPFIAWLWYAKKLSRNSGWIILIVSTLSGFFVFAPMIPYQFQLAVLGKQQSLPVPIIGVFILLAIFWLYSLVAGRVFCGHICPVGTTQEIVYLVPVKKFILRHKPVTLAFRWVFFFLFIIAAVFFSLGLLQFFGIHEFFHIDVASPLFFVFGVLLLVSVFVYRPFCRLFCPYGALLSLAAAKSLFKFKNTDRCVDCLRCIRACPTGEAGTAANKAECYMCGRCIEACGDTGGIEYRK